MAPTAPASPDTEAPTVVGAGVAPSARAGLRAWSGRQWVAACAGAVVSALVIGLPTDVIPNPVFGRPVPVTAWSVPVLMATAILGGLVLGTYVRADGGVAPGEQLDRPGRLGGVAGALSFFAIGCPVCNKLVVLALGSSGAMNWFAPVQPYLAVASVVLLTVALRARLRGATACRIPAG